MGGGGVWSAGLGGRGEVINQESCDRVEEREKGEGKGINKMGKMRKRMGKGKWCEVFFRVSVWGQRQDRGARAAGRIEDIN